MVGRLVRIVIGALFLSGTVTGCSNVGSSNGQNSRGGNPNNTPGAQLPAHDQATTSTPSSPNN
jgi:hypothetical protein